MTISYLADAPVALILFLLILGISILGLVNEDFRDRHLLLPYDMLVYKEYWRLLTSGFIHGSVAHLSLNMVTFFFFSFILEHRLGHWQFFVFFILALILSNLAVVLRYRQDTAYEGSLGASGAISAVVLGTIICNPYLQFGLPFVSELYPWFTVPGYIVGLLYIVYSLVSMFRKKPMRVNHDAHFWGAIAGIVLTFVLKPNVWTVLDRFIQGA